MASSNRKTSQKQPGDTKQIEPAPMKFPSDPERRHDSVDEQDVYVDEDELMADPPRPPTSAIRFQPTSTTGSQPRDRRSERDTTRQPVPNIAGGPRRGGQISDAYPGPIATRAGRTTASGPIPGTGAPPPLPPAHQRSWQSMHWMVYVGIGMIAAIALWVSFSALLAWGTNEYNNIVYGYPRIYQMDAVVGHGDSPAHPSHFIALNLHGQVIVIELPAGNPSKSYEYIGPDLIANGNDQIPITLSFSDINHNGKPDMFIHIQDREIHFCNDGTKFTPCSS